MHRVKNHFYFYISLTFFSFIALGLWGMGRSAQATEFEISVDTAATVITVLEGSIDITTQGGEVLSVGEAWKPGTSGEKLKAKAVNALAETKDNLIELKALLETVLQGEAVPQRIGHADAVLARASFEPIGKIVQAGATDEGVRRFSPLQDEIKRRLNLIVDILTPAPEPTDCSVCGDFSCCTAGSLCCQDARACPNGCPR